ncbi:MAG: hypothetical protein ACMG6E_01515, partial [Candidatus Roizmanbacteria bacterium]
MSEDQQASQQDKLNRIKEKLRASAVRVATATVLAAGVYRALPHNEEMPPMASITEVVSIPPKADSPEFAEPAPVTIPLTPAENFVRLSVVELMRTAGEPAFISVDKDGPSKGTVRYDKHFAEAYIHLPQEIKDLFSLEGDPQHGWNQLKTIKPELIDTIDFSGTEGANIYVYGAQLLIQKTDGKFTMIMYGYDEGGRNNPYTILDTVSLETIKKVRALFNDYKGLPYEMMNTMNNFSKMDISENDYDSLSKLIQRFPRAGYYSLNILLETSQKVGLDITSSMSLFDKILLPKAGDRQFDIAGKYLSYLSTHTMGTGKNGRNTFEGYQVWTDTFDPYLKDYINASQGNATAIAPDQMFSIVSKLDFKFDGDKKRVKSFIDKYSDFNKFRQENRLRTPTFDYEKGTSPEDQIWQSKDPEAALDRWIHFYKSLSISQDGYELPWEKLVDHVIDNNSDTVAIKRNFEALMRYIDNLYDEQVKAEESGSSIIDYPQLLFDVLLRSNKNSEMTVDQILEKIKIINSFGVSTDNRPALYPTEIIGILSEANSHTKLDLSEINSPDDLVKLLARVYSEDSEGKLYSRSIASKVNVMHEWQDRVHHSDSFRETFVKSLSTQAKIRLIANGGSIYPANYFYPSSDQDSVPHDGVLAPADESTYYNMVLWTSTFVQVYDELEKAPPEQVQQILDDNPEMATKYAYIVGSFGRLAAQLKKYHTVLVPAIKHVLESPDATMTDWGTLGEGLLVAMDNPVYSIDIPDFLAQRYRDYSITQ